MNEVCIIGAKRTVQGKFLGALAKCSAVDLAAAAGTAALGTVPSTQIEQVIVGNVLGAGAGMNIARQIAGRMDLRAEVVAYSVNMMCGSGLHAVALAAQTIRAGEASVILCGGTESMSNAPYLLDRARSGYKLGDGALIDSLLRDGLIDAFSKQHMGVLAEAIAATRNITRAQQDAFAAESQHRYFTALSGGVFADEIVAVNGLQADEHPREDVTTAKLAALKPAFKSDGTVTAGNSSGINDGAAMLVVCSRQMADAQGWKPLATIMGAASVGCEPQLMGLGPIHATQRLCRQLRCGPTDFDLVELNEAFAAQALACIDALGLDPARVNPHGGAIALGHPIGASGARVLTHLAHRIARGQAKSGLATLCVGGGMGIAAALR